MFSGIVTSLAKVESIEEKEHGLCLKLSNANRFCQKLEIGASIAIEGVCLTVTDFKPFTEEVYHLVFDIIHETLQKTTLASLKQGDWVHFERSLCFGSEIGGHILSGHIENKVRIERVEVSGGSYCVF